MTKKKPQASPASVRRTILVALGQVFLACSVIFWALIGFFYLWNVNPNSICLGSFVPTQRNIERALHLELPPSTQNLTHTVDLQPDIVEPECTIWLTFEMSPDDLQIFESDITLYGDTFEEAMITGPHFQELAAAQNWSQPENSLAIVRSMDILGWQWLFIDTSNPDSWTVYVIDYWMAFW